MGLAMLLLGTAMKLAVGLVGSIVVLSLIPPFPNVGVSDKKIHSYKLNLLAENDRVKNCLDPLTTQSFTKGVEGPRAFTLNGNHLFVTDPQGLLKDVDLDTDQVTTITRLGRKCRGEYDAARCGLPMSVRVMSDDYLLVADAYLGTKGVNMTTGEVEIIVPATRMVEGKPSMYTYDVVYSARDNAIYMSVTSTKFPKKWDILIAFTPPSGRIMKYDLDTDSLTVVLDSLDTPQGIELSPNEDFLLIAEMNQRRLVRLWLHGPKAGTRDLLLENLPGITSIVPRKASAEEGGYYVSMSDAAVDPADIDSTLTVINLPLLVKGEVRFFYVASKLGAKIQSVAPNKYTGIMDQELATIDTYMTDLVATRGGVYHVTDLGEVDYGLIGSKTKKIYMAERRGNRLYMGIDKVGVASVDLAACLEGKQQKRVKDGGDPVAVGL